MNALFFLDACAVLAFLKGEAEKAAVETLIESAMRGEIALYMNIINLLEVRYGLMLEKTDEEVEILWRDIRRLPIVYIRIMNDAIFTEAAGIKARYHVALGDAIGCATAKVYGGRFVTKDKGDFAKIDAACPDLIYWLR
jgi:predicted nucleic acid-binding protein